MESKFITLMVFITFMGDTIKVLVLASFYEILDRMKCKFYRLRIFLFMALSISLKKIHHEKYNMDFRALNTLS